MKYLTKEWYELCQRTGLHFGMSVHNGVGVYDEALYLRLYKRKENAFVKMQHEVYDVDPRYMLEQDGAALVPLDKFADGGKIDEDDMVVYHMTLEEKEKIQKLIANYDARAPFDEKKCREEFRDLQEMFKKGAAEKLPHKLLQKIADIRVLALGYCTGEVLKELKNLSRENDKKVNRILNEYSKVQQEEPVPQRIKEKFGFHDCEVMEFTVSSDIVIRLDTQGGFTNFNTIVFTEAEIIKQDEPIVDSKWIYEELYCTGNGYEAHMLFIGKELKELIIRCKDIVIEEK